MPATPNIHELKHLLGFTQAHLKYIDSIAKATGEKFNIFRVLRVGHLEVRTHSPILAELLNPKGLHSQGAVFLRLFLKQVGVTDFHEEAATVTMEYHAGEVTENSGGRIDLTIDDHHGAIIVIENKIYASDQPRQLQRYRTTYPSASLFYLTLDGSRPTNVSDDEFKALDCKLISYEHDVLSWIRKCHKEAAALPGLREMLKQYSLLIEELTNQSTTRIMYHELITEILKSSEALQATFALRDAIPAVQTQLFSRLDTELEKIAEKNGLQRIGPLGDMGGKEASIVFTSPDLARHRLRIAFQFGSARFQGMYFGFAKEVKEPTDLDPALLEAFKKHFQALAPTPWWPAFANCEAPYCNWGAEGFMGLYSGDFTAYLEVKVAKLAQIAREVCA